MPLIVRHFCDFTNMWTLRYAAVIMFHWSCIKIALRAVGKYLTGLKMFVPLIARIQTHAIICILVARSPVFVGRCKYTPLGSRRQRMRRLALWRSSGSQIVCALYNNVDVHAVVDIVWSLTFYKSWGISWLPERLSAFPLLLGVTYHCA